jgi:radical SAM superfamily enzyme YgiQ (UPF0313 family)
MYSISIATPYPGTPLYDMAKKEGWLIKKDWKDYNMSNPVMSLPHFSSRSMKLAAVCLHHQVKFRRMLSRLRKARGKTHE